MLAKEVQELSVWPQKEERFPSSYQKKKVLVLCYHEVSGST